MISDKDNVKIRRRLRINALENMGPLKLQSV
jgi:hypothetical protein